LRLAPDVSVRVATETVGGRKIAHTASFPQAIAARPPPAVRLNLDLALPN
jgi:hypothetical protein